MEDLVITHTEFTLWLIPREPLRSALQAIIRRLAESLDAVEFEPHVTVFSGRSTEAEACEAAQRIASQFSPLELKAIGLDNTPQYTKTLFVQFEESAIARRMFNAARSYSPASDYALNPHLSLLYKHLPGPKRRELCEMPDVPAGEYQFDRLRLVETDAPIEDSGPIHRWRTCLDAPLAGGGGVQDPGERT
jgi:hypothetical protein